MPEPLPLRQGDPERIGEHRLVGFLGEGGQGVVYLALTPSGERVALKVLHAKLADDPAAQRRFRREAEATRRVAQFCTARVLEVDTVGARPYILSEYVDGESLHQAVLRDGPRAEHALLRLAVATATALVAIHRAGIVHRDLKPSNVLLGPDGPRVIDFGIARALDAGQSVTSGVIGTPAYMAPEHFHGQDVGMAGDVFAWAGTMVFAATGRSPFGSGDLPVVMHAILSGTPDLSGVPESLRPLLHAAFAKDPRERPTSGEVLDALLNPGGASVPGPASRPEVRDAPPPSSPSSPVPSSSVPPSPVPPSPSPSSPFLPSPSPSPSPSLPSSPAPSWGFRTSPLGGLRRHRRVLTAGAAVVTACALVVALWPRTTGGSGSGPPSGQAVAGAARTGPDAALTSIAAPSAKRGGTIRMAASFTPDSLDPGNSYYVSLWNVMRLYGRSLTMYRPAPGRAGREPVGDLAEGPGVPADDSRTWTYRLREGLRYEDGTPIVSADVKHAVLRTLDRDVLDEGPHHFRSLLDLPEGYRGPYRSPGADTSSAIETPDDRTIVFHLLRPYPTFDHVVQSPQTMPVPPSKDTRQKYGSRVLSSGPYRFGTLREGRRLVLVRNPRWSAATDPHRRALPDRYEIDFGLDQDTIDSRLVSEDVDLDLAARADVGLADRIAARPDLRARSDVATVNQLRFIALNPEVPPFDNVSCRRAVFAAADRVSLRDAFGTGLRSGRIATGLLAPGVSGYRPLNLYQTGGGDLESARGHLAACGRPGGFTARIGYRTDRLGEPEAADRLRRSLERVGIRLALRGFPEEDYLDDHGGNPAELRREAIGLVMMRWNPDWPEGRDYLSYIVDSREIEDGGSFNVSVRLPEVDRLLDRAYVETDAARREDLWSQVDRAVMEQAVILPVQWETHVLLRSGRLTNVHVSDIFQDYDYLNMGVS
ncbi:ABC transporter substrate-binding protein [Streptosporangium sp. NPDC050855]|uniref:ABC transporter substrate-binding protein n=1 Tax=Streptosporangium sp. NPDC050855 TaxID=3366194 RepID=UPI00379140BB